jgi:hypothetical protein
MISSKNIRKYRIHKHCKNEDSEDCILWSACDDCFYYEPKLICPNCEREIPNKEHLNKDGSTCKWCKVE